MFNIGRTEKILIGLHSDNFVDIQTQWELSGVIDEKSNLTNILENKPFEIFLLHGPLPLLDNGKTCIWKIFEIMREASIEKIFTYLAVAELENLYVILLIAACLIS